MKSSELEELTKHLVRLTVDRGFPAELGALMAGELKTAYAIRRMVGYLSHVQPPSAEDMVDEMLAICADRDHFVEKKTAEYWQGKQTRRIWEEKNGDE